MKFPIRHNRDLKPGDTVLVDRHRPYCTFVGVEDIGHDRYMKYTFTHPDGYPVHLFAAPSATAGTNDVPFPNWASD